MYTRRGFSTKFSTQLLKSRAACYPRREKVTAEERSWLFACCAFVLESANGCVRSNEMYSLQRLSRRERYPGSLFDRDWKEMLD